MNPARNRLWYFACDCTAKFFHADRATACPRCGVELVSSEQQIPPWEQRMDDEEWARAQAEDYLDDQGIDHTRLPVLHRALTEYYLRMKGSADEPAKK